MKWYRVESEFSGFRIEEIEVIRETPKKLLVRYNYGTVYEWKERGWCKYFENEKEALAYKLKKLNDQRHDAFNQYNTITEQVVSVLAEIQQL